MIVRRAGALLAVGLLAQGCRSIPAPVVLPADDPRPRAFLEAVTARSQQRQGLSGRARIEVESDSRELHLRGNLVLVIQRPARLRVEVLGLLGQSVAVLVSDGERFEWFDSRDRSYEEGPVHDDLLWQRIRVPLSTSEVVNLVLGEPVPRSGLAVSGASRVGEEEIRVDLSDGAGVLRQRIAFDPGAKVRAGETFADPGQLSRRSRFDDYQEQDGIAFAREISVEFPQLDLRAGLSLSDVELNPPVAPDLFQLRPAAPGSGS